MKTIKRLVFAGCMITGILLFSCRHEPELMPGTPEVCFQSQVMLIINSNCNVAGCHGGGGEAPSLAAYNDVMRYVTPGKPLQSKLHKVVTAHSNLMGLMPPKPKEALTSSQINTINIWILQGAKPTASTCP